MDSTPPSRSPTTPSPEKVDAADPPTGLDPQQIAMQQMLLQMQASFESVSSTILSRIEAMSERVEMLEATLETLKDQAPKEGE
mmetsp:Transcript_6888/g.22129  ORF Transcript_6888/g.22129 Transcript_6888/m.22129 type:complete len:83 (-) Transcript_6888:490-738(-)